MLLISFVYFILQLKMVCSHVLPVIFGEAYSARAIAHGGSGVSSGILLLSSDKMTAPTYIDVTDVPRLNIMPSPLTPTQFHRMMEKSPILNSLIELSIKTNIYCAQICFDHLAGALRALTYHFNLWCSVHSVMCVNASVGIYNLHAKYSTPRFNTGIAVQCRASTGTYNLLVKCPMPRFNTGSSYCFCHCLYLVLQFQCNTVCILRAKALVPFNPACSLCMYKNGRQDVYL